MDDEDEDEDEAGPSMTTEERQAAMDKLVPSLPPDEWGLQNQQTKKPSPSKHRLPTLTPEKYEGASDDSDSDNEMGGNVDGEEGEDTAQVEGDEQDDVDMDMEAEEFLSFTRDALGLSQEQYDDILRSRKERGGTSSVVIRCKHVCPRVLMGSSSNRQPLFRLLCLRNPNPDPPKTRPPQRDRRKPRHRRRIDQYASRYRLQALWDLRRLTVFRRRQ